LHRDCRLLIGAGCLIDPMVLVSEIRSLEAEYGVSQRLYLAENAHIVTPAHLMADRLEESSRTTKVGSTLTGTTPAYRDKIGRVGYRVKDAFSQGKLPETDLPEWNEALSQLRGLATMVDPVEMLRRYPSTTVLAEGAQGMGLDLDWGDYTWVSSSSFGAAYACVSGGFSPRELGDIWGVMKPYTTRVGTGALQAEISDTPFGDWLVEKGNEYGTVTGRKRRVGLLDIPLVQRFAKMNGVDHIALTKADIPALWLDEGTGKWPILGLSGLLQHLSPAGETLYQRASCLASKVRLCGLPVYLTSYGPERMSLIESV
jgi:adenylosuccinate synthase